MTLEYFNDLIETIDANWPIDDWTLEHDYENEWWVLIKNVDYHRFSKAFYRIRDCKNKRNRYFALVIK